LKTKRQKHEKAGAQIQKTGGGKGFEGLKRFNLGKVAQSVVTSGGEFTIMKIGYSRKTT